MMPSLENNDLENKNMPSIENNVNAGIENDIVDSLDTIEPSGDGYVANPDLGETKTEVLSLDDNLLNNGFQPIEKNNDTNEEPAKPKKKRLLPFLLMVLIIALFIGGFVVYKIKFVKPESFYNSLITSAFKFNIKSEDFNSFSTNIKASTDDENLIVLNDYSLNLKYEEDSRNAINYKASLNELDNVLLSLDFTYKDKIAYLSLNGLSDKTFSINDVDADLILGNHNSETLNNCLKYFANDLNKAIKSEYLTRKFTKAKINGKDKYVFANVLNINDGNVKTFFYDLLTNVNSDEKLLKEIADNYKVDVIKIKDSIDSLINSIDKRDTGSFNFRMIIYTNIISESVEGFECAFSNDNILININGNEKDYGFTLTYKGKLLLKGNAIDSANKKMFILELVNEDNLDNNIKIEFTNEKGNSADNYSIKVTALKKFVTLTVENVKKLENDVTISKSETNVYNELTEDDISNITMNFERIFKKTNFYKKVIKKQSNNTNTLIADAQKLVDAAKNAMKAESYDDSNIIKNGKSVCFNGSWLYKNSNYMNEELKGSVLAKYVNGEYQYNVWITDEENYISNVNIAEIAEDKIHEGSGSSSIAKCSNSTIAEVECLGNEKCMAK